MKPDINRVAILGMGLMGGSLGLALRALSSPPRVYGYARREESLRAAIDTGAIDHACTCPAEAVCEADVVVLCVPVLAMPALAAETMGHAAPDCVFTDVGSTKREVMALMDDHRINGLPQFVGSHPIAGSHMTGIGAARADLYRDATVVITPGDDALPGSVERLKQLWTLVGSRVVVMSPSEHDAMLARTSHLPHLVAAAVVETVLDDRLPDAALFCGSGFRDTTRVAAGSEELWHDICMTNRVAIDAALQRFSAVIGRLQRAVESGDSDALQDFLDSARRRRSGLDDEERT